MRFEATNDSNGDLKQQKNRDQQKNQSNADANRKKKQASIKNKSTITIRKQKAKRLSESKNTPAIRTLQTQRLSESKNAAPYRKQKMQRPIKNSRKAQKNRVYRTKLNDKSRCRLLLLRSKQFSTSSLIAFRYCSDGFASRTPLILRLFLCTPRYISLIFVVSPPLRRFFL